MRGVSVGVNGNRSKEILNIAKGREHGIVKVIILQSEGNNMAKYQVELSKEDIQMIKDCHSKNPSIMKAMENAKKVED